MLANLELFVRRPILGLASLALSHIYPELCHLLSQTPSPCWKKRPLCQGSPKMTLNSASQIDWRQASGRTASSRQGALAGRASARASMLRGLWFECPGASFVGTPCLAGCTGKPEGNQSVVLFSPRRCNFEYTFLSAGLPPSFHHKGGGARIPVQGPCFAKGAFWRFTASRFSCP